MNIPKKKYIIKYLSCISISKIIIIKKAFKENRLNIVSSKNNKIKIIIKKKLIMLI